MHSEQHSHESNSSLYNLMHVFVRLQFVSQQQFQGFYVINVIIYSFLKEINQNRCDKAVFLMSQKLSRC